LPALVRYTIGIDPGARNTAVACSDDAFFEPCTLDLGPLKSTSDSEVVEVLLESLWGLFSDERVEKIICEAQASWGTEKSETITARCHLVQGALQALAFAWEKQFELVTPMAWKKHYNGGIWKRMSYDENKAWSVRKATELFGEAYVGRVHHECEAKLLACYGATP